MNKAFEKILDRLEEELIPLNQEITSYELKDTDNPKYIYAVGRSNALTDFKYDIKQLAEEFATDTNVGNNSWIPTKTRPMTDEEKEYYSEYLFEDNGFIYECPLPNDGQEVLITSNYGSVDKTTFYTDCGNYFENYEDYDEVIAWKPLPQPYKESE